MRLTLLTLALSLGLLAGCGKSNENATQTAGRDSVAAPFRITQVGDNHFASEESQTLNSGKQASAKLDLTWPALQGDGNPQQLKKMQATVDQTLSNLTVILGLTDSAHSGAPSEVLGAFFDRFRADADPAHANWELTVKHRTLLNKGRLLSLAIDYHYLGPDAPLDGQSYVTLDLTSGNKLALNDLLKAGAAADFVRIAEETFRKQESIPAGKTLAGADYPFPDGKFFVPQDFGATEQGLELPYDLYGEDVHKAFVVRIPWSVAAATLKADGPAGEFLRP